MEPKLDLAGNFHGVDGFGIELLVFGQPNLVLNLDLKSCVPNIVVTLVLYIHTHELIQRSRSRYLQRTVAEDIF